MKEKKNLKTCDKCPKLNEDINPYIKGSQYSPSGNKSKAHKETAKRQKLQFNISHREANEHLKGGVIRLNNNFLREKMGYLKIIVRKMHTQGKNCHLTLLMK